MKPTSPPASNDDPLPHIVKFRYGYSLVSAIACVIKDDHPHVLRLTLIRGISHRLLRIFLRLPLAWNLVRTLWPTYFLPPTLVLKKLKPGWDEEFENEQDMYKKLEPLQGRVIPICYGEVWCEGARALLLSEVHGVLANNQEPPRLEYTEFEHRLKAAWNELARFGVAYDDKHLDNVYLVDDRVMFVDLEMTEEVSNEWLREVDGWAINQFLEQYGGYLDSADFETE